MDTLPHITETIEAERAARRPIFPSGRTLEPPVNRDLYIRAATVLEWIDGDTVDVLIDLGFSVSIKQRVRVRWLNTPEIRGHEKAAGVLALCHACDLAPPRSQVTLRSHKDIGGDKFGRYLADITLADGRDYATCMVTSGHGKHWTGQGEKP